MNKQTRNADYEKNEKQNCTKISAVIRQYLCEILEFIYMFYSNIRM